MRRIRILFYWLFVNKNNVSVGDMARFLFQPKVQAIAKRYIAKIEEKEDFEISFKGVPGTLHWPKSFTIDRMYQVTAETFDTNDWHFYQKEHTTIEPGEILLDIGTAEGLFPLTVADKCSHMYLIEPSTQFYGSLQKTFAAHAGKTTIINTAVGNEDGVIFFDENSLDGAVADQNSGSAKEMPIHKIDTLLAGKQITYLKTDIEGFEAEMLKGAEQTIRRNKPKIAITTYHTQNDPAELIALVKGFVPEYNHYVKGIYEETPKPVMIHFWI